MLFPSIDGTNIIKIYSWKFFYKRRTNIIQHLFWRTFIIHSLVPVGTYIMWNKYTVKVERHALKLREVSTYFHHKVMERPAFKLREVPTSFHRKVME